MSPNQQMQYIISHQIKMKQKKKRGENDIANARIPP